MNPIEFTEQEAAEIVGKRLNAIPFPPLGELTIREYFESLDPLFAQILFAYDHVPAPIDPVGTIPMMFLFKLLETKQMAAIELEQAYTEMAKVLRQRFLSGEIDAENPQQVEGDEA